MCTDCGQRLLLAEPGRDEARHTARIRERPAQDLAGAVRDGAHTIISEYLIPAGKALWADMIKAVKTLGDVNPTDTTALLNAPDKRPAVLTSLSIA
jgi:hypothetical protein